MDFSPSELKLLAGSLEILPQKLKTIIELVGGKESPPTAVININGETCTINKFGSSER